MRLALIPGAFLLATGTPADYYGIPPWLYLAGTILGSSLVGKVVWDRQQRQLEKRLSQLAGDKTRAERDHIYQEIAERMGAQFEALQAKYNELSARHDATVSELARVRSDRSRVVASLRAELRSLEEQLATTRAQAGLDERRRQWPSHEEPEQ